MFRTAKTRNVRVETEDTRLEELSKGQMPNKGRCKQQLNLRIKDVQEKHWSGSALLVPPPPPPQGVRKMRPLGES